MEKNVEISMLCQIYGKVLTEKQYELLNDYYNNDLSLSEIAENNDITRQAVRDIIKKAENKLYELEENISLMKKSFEDKKTINKIEEQLIEIEKISNSNKDNQKEQTIKSIEIIRKQLKNLI